MGSAKVSSVWVLWVLWFAVCGGRWGSSLGVAALKMPFRVHDVLPVLPREVSWVMLNNLHSAADLLPAFVGSVLPGNGSVEWKGACFEQNRAEIQFTDGGDRGDGLGGGILRLTVCM